MLEMELNVMYHNLFTQCMLYYIIDNIEVNNARVRGRCKPNEFA